MVKRLVILKMFQRKTFRRKNFVGEKNCIQKSNGETVGHNKNISKKKLSAKKFVSEKVVFRIQMVEQLVIIEVFQRNRKDPALKIKIKIQQ